MNATLSPGDLTPAAWSSGRASTNLPAADRRLRLRQDPRRDDRPERRPPVPCAGSRIVVKARPSLGWAPGESELIRLRWKNPRHVLADGRHGGAADVEKRIA